MLLAHLVALVSPQLARAYNLQSTESGAHVRWYAAEVELQISPELEEHFTDIPVARLLKQAMTAWSGLDGAPLLRIAPGTPGVVGFEEKKKPSNGVYLVRNWKLFPDALAVTVATFESRTGKLVDTDILVNANFKFALLPASVAPPGSYDLLSVMTHELGHVLGLGDASDAPEATMWPNVSPGETHQRDLEPDDEEGVAQAYGAVHAPSGDGSGCGGASVLPSRAPGRQLDQIGVFFLLWLALWLLSRASPVHSRSGGGLGRRNTRAPTSRVIVLGAALLFGGLFAPSPRARPTFDELAELGPEELAPHIDPAQRLRFASFIKGSERLVVGRAVASRSERREGLIVTRFTVRGGLRSAELEYPGGSLDGLTQVVSGQAPPVEGDLLLLALKKQGPHGWAHLRDGQLSGGTLGASLEWP
jgi:hypothetical protein